MQTNISLDQQEKDLRNFDVAFYDRLEAASPFLVRAVANIIHVQLCIQASSRCDTEDVWDALRKLGAREICRHIGIPLSVLRKINPAEIHSPLLIDELIYLSKTLKKKPRCARWLLHTRSIQLQTARAMDMISCDDAKMWDWFNTLEPYSAGNITDLLVGIHKVLQATGRKWQNGMVKDAHSLARTYERVISINFPEPKFTDIPHVIEAIRTGKELAYWGLEQRNCAVTFASRCVDGTLCAYRMLSPAEATVVISTECGGWVVDAKARENGELSQQQLEVLLDWCRSNNVCVKFYMERGLHEL
jgi:hypothetical protein